MWELLKAEAREDGKLEERTVNRKDGPVVVATPYGIRYRQLGQWIRAQESMQLFKRPNQTLRQKLARRCRHLQWGCLGRW